MIETVFIMENTPGTRVGPGSETELWPCRKKAQKVGENNGQLSFRPPPRVAHASRLGQTPGTWGWSRLRDRTLAVPKKRVKICFFFLEKEN